MSSNKINRVAIFGGTHGNELTGIYLIKKFESLPHLIQRPSFETVTFFANPKAYAIGKRYYETDLNRCFTRQDLENPNLSTYEAQRAKEISRIYGTGGEKQADFVIDLHSTTSNMGLTVILPNLNRFHLELSAYLVSINPEIKILYSITQYEDNPHLDSISEFGCTVEVGAVAQGILDANLFQQTEALIYAILDFVETYNQGIVNLANNILKFYEVTNTIDYPRNESGEIRAMIHPGLQFQDYQPLNAGEPMFLTFLGEDIVYQGESTIYPVFINEAAYYEKGTAMCVTQISEIKLR
ncbi:aspartoacylase [Brunnivagina elsteri]|uniref:Probable aspartoacylase n=1 Tax=Brunnivagina elsteri CCALA 953 TaxID=987040 RepID=A0A2A2TFN2_9CYAN|nr:aspartoacylase [Calothrix elsteri]PAX52607.1 aspartoacylase [Calothrix elsteri CCALA 953]